MKAICNEYLVLKGILLLTTDNIKGFISFSSLRKYKVYEIKPRKRLSNSFGYS